MAVAGKTVYGGCIVAALVALGLFVSVGAQDVDVPLSKISQNVGSPTLKFFYW